MSEGIKVMERTRMRLRISDSGEITTITKKVRVVSFARDTPSGPIKLSQTNYQYMSKGIKVRMRLRTDGRHADRYIIRTYRMAIKSAKYFKDSVLGNRTMQNASISPKIN